MQTIKNVLLHERSQMQYTINGLRADVGDSPPNAHRADGNRAMLKMKEEHLMLVDALLEAAEDPVVVMCVCYEWLTAAQKNHQRMASRQYSYTRRNEEWWRSLEVVQFLSQLLRKIEAQTGYNAADTCS
jgi:hypothetical protein